MTDLTNQEKQDIALQHISFSRINTFNTGLKTFEKRYFEGKTTTTQAMEKGKEVDDNINYGIVKNAEDEKIQLQLPKTNDIEVISNYKFSTSMDYEGVSYKCVGEADYFGNGNLWLGERKNTYKRYIKSMIKYVKKQLHFYSFLNYLITGDTITSGTAYLIIKDDDTRENTGEVVEIPITLSAEEVKRQRRKVERYIDQIKRLYPV